MTLNVLRMSRINPQLSAYSQLWGNFSFNFTPIAPMGTKLLIHEKLLVRETWALHIVKGWYLGPVMQHYRCFCIWAAETNAERIVDIVAWFPNNLYMPQSSPHDTVVAAAYDLIHALLKPGPVLLIPFISESIHNLLLELSDIFVI